MAPAETIRPARDDDGPAIARLIADSFADYHDCYFVDAEVPELAAIARHFAAKGGQIWVACPAPNQRQQPAIIGVFAIHPTATGSTHVQGSPMTNDANDADHANWEITKVYVAASCRGTGLGYRLFAKAREHAAAAGATRLILWTDTRFRDAHRFYARQGFTRQPRTRQLNDLSQTEEYFYACLL